MEKIKHLLNICAEAAQGLGISFGYLWIKAGALSEIQKEMIHSIFSIVTALIIAVGSTVVIHYTKKWLERKKK